MKKGEIVIRVGDKKPIGLFKGYYRDEEWYNSVTNGLSTSNNMSFFNLKVEVWRCIPVWLQRGRCRQSPMQQGRSMTARWSSCR